MSRTIRCIGLAVVLASLMLSSTSLRAPAQDKKAEEKPKAPPPPLPAAPPAAIPVPVKGGPRPAIMSGTKAADPRFTDDVTIPTDRQSKRLIEAAQDYIKKKEWQ